MRAVRDLYPGCEVDEVKEQGYCSFTLRVSPTSKSERVRIIQIRPVQHSLDFSIVRVAKDIYGSLVPEIRQCGISLPYPLQAFEMDCIPGIPFSRCQPKTRFLEPETWNRQVRLVRSFAEFVARGWPASCDGKMDRRKMRADSPIFSSVFDFSDAILVQCTGKLGSRIFPKLSSLSRELPSSTLRQRAADTLSRLRQIVDWPLIVNHGDLIPSNILIDEESWEVKGVVDWAEAEVLPFGMCVYGLEHLLGYLDVSKPTGPKWVWYDGAEELRVEFWGGLWEKIKPKSGNKEEWRKDAECARDAGILLWYGYAWDEGRINRVVNSVDDREELEMLSAFLGINDN
jgi:hypothetical protein